MHRMEDTEGSSVSPLWPRAPAHWSLEAVGRTHWSSVFLYFTFFLHLLLAQPFFCSIPFLSCPHITPLSQLTPPPRAESEFGGCYTPCFLTYFPCQLCDLSSPKALGMLLQLPHYNQKAQVSPKVWAQSCITQSCTPERVSDELSKRGATALRALLSSQASLAAPASLQAQRGVM